jgi:D-cysteine desulfhydrase
MARSIAEALNQYPRETLTRRPTPLDYLPHLSKELDIEFYLKRDDLTDLALGGGKPRKLEYEIAYARANGADYLVTCGSAQSNHARLTTAAARHVGMDCAVVLSRDDFQAFQGNLLTVYLMGAQVEFVETDDHWDLEEHARSLCNKLTKEGRTPHYIPVSGTTPRSCLGYVSCGLELADQMEGADLEFDAIYAPFGTGGIFTALLMALREREIMSPLVGISVNRELKRCEENHEKWWSALCELLDRDPAAERGVFEIHDEFVGREYGDPTEAGLDAIMLMAQSEGILLDPVYSGKVLAGLCAHRQAGRWIKGQHILMLHSGGSPALFAYHEAIRAHLEKRGVSIGV